jgi:hypothetical protein
MVKKNHRLETSSEWRASYSIREAIGCGCLFLLLVTCHRLLLFGQQPQAQSGQPLYPVNAKYVNGVAPGYWPTAGSGLTLNLSAGTAWCSNPPSLVTYPGGTLSLAANATSYVYLDPAANCAPDSVVYLSPPTAPALSQVSGGSLGSRTYYVKTTYVNTHGETTLSSESTFAVSANNLLQIASPPSVAGATGWNLYVSDVSGTEAKQNVGDPIALGTAWTEPASGMPYLGGFPGPGSNSTGLESGQIPLAKVTTDSASITSITDLRSWNVDAGAQAPVFRVDLLPGADLGEKLGACFARLPAAGGTCDARRLTGRQTISANPFASLPEFASVTVLFGQANITTVPLEMPANSQQGVIIRGAGSRGRAPLASTRQSVTSVTWVSWPSSHIPPVLRGRRLTRQASATAPSKTFSTSIAAAVGWTAPGIGTASFILQLIRPLTTRTGSSIRSLTVEEVPPRFSSLTMAGLESAATTHRSHSSKIRLSIRP